MLQNLPQAGITRRKTLAQRARNDLQSYRQYRADAWGAERPHLLAAFLTVVEIIRLEGLMEPDDERAMLNLYGRIRERAAAQR